MNVFRILFFISMISFYLTCNAFADVTFKHFSDYTDIVPTKKSDPKICRIHYHAKEKIIDRAESPVYKKNKWKLVMRRTFFLAQVDVTMSRLYQYFLGYSTDLDYVLEKGNYYLARRGFKSFTKWDDGAQIKKVNSTYYFNDYALQDDGTLLKNDKRKHLSGLGSIVALSHFFADIDSAWYNYGAQEIDNEVRYIDYDLDDGFKFSEEDQFPWLAEQRLAEEFGHDFINMTWYQQEKTAMLKKIAETDFSVIEQIIRNNLSDTDLESDCIKQPHSSIIKNASKLTVDEIIQELRIRQNKLRQEFNQE